jgi:N-acetylglucosaminyl-diphospho-decaprenol L-rhamnosyltransferase
VRNLGRSAEALSKLTSSRVSAIVVNFNSGGDLVACLESLKAQTHAVDELIVVDNASDDQSLEVALSTFPDVIAVPNSINKGFAAAANQGARSATGDVLFFLNPDVSLSDDCVQLISDALRRAPGVAGTAVLLKADTDDLHGCTIDRLGYPTSLRGVGDALYVAGAALATQRELFEDLGGFDDRYFMFVEDVDYCWRVLLAGFEVTACSDAQAVHRGGASAQGGYVRSGKLETTVFRFVLRERNTLATLLKCASASWLAWFIPVHLFKTAALAVGALCIRRPDLARGLVAGLTWNVTQLRSTYRLRLRISRTKRGVRTASQRIYRGWLAFERIRQAGMPSFVDPSKPKSELGGKARRMRG